MNVPIDLGIIVIPYILIRKTQLKTHERRIIFLVFAAQSLGTIATYVYSHGLLAILTLSASLEFTVSGSIARPKFKISTGTNLSG
jgi:hypothetical protein